MRGRKPSQFKLKSKDKTSLRKLLRNGQTPLRVARRAQILLGRDSDQHRVVSLGETFEQDPATIWRICERFGCGPNAWIKMMVSISVQRYAVSCILTVGRIAFIWLWTMVPVTPATTPRNS